TAHPNICSRPSTAMLMIFAPPLFKEKDFFSSVHGANLTVVAARTCILLGRTAREDMKSPKTSAVKSTARPAKPARRILRTTVAIHTYIFRALVRADLSRAA